MRVQLESAASTFLIYASKELFLQTAAGVDLPNRDTGYNLYVKYIRVYPAIEWAIMNPRFIIILILCCKSDWNSISLVAGGGKST